MRRSIVLALGFLAFVGAPGEVAARAIPGQDIVVLPDDADVTMVTDHHRVRHGAQTFMRYDYLSLGFVDDGLDSNTCDPSNPEPFQFAVCRSVAAGEVTERAYRHGHGRHRWTARRSWRGRYLPVLRRAPRSRRVFRPRDP